MSASGVGVVKPRKERKDNADKRRRQILDATLRSIVAHGLAKTTLATVATEAGLSQGVAVFYFKSKNGLLTAALRGMSEKYEAHWRAAMDKADPAPAKRLRAIIEADFDPKICNPDTLSVWFAFWGEQKFTPTYVEITEQYDRRRSDAIRQICRDLSPNDFARADLVGDCIDTLTDGFWQKLHLFPESHTRATAKERTMQVLMALFPEAAEYFS